MQDITLDGGEPRIDQIPSVRAAQVSDPQPEFHPFHFTGTTGGFFPIWIVNLFLTIITLGLYSPWATVRRR